MTNPTWFSPASERIQVTKCFYIAVLGDSKSQGISVTIDIKPMKSLIVTRRISLTPKGIARTRIVYTSTTLQGSNDRLLHWSYVEELTTHRCRNQHNNRNISARYTNFNY